MKRITCLLLLSVFWVGAASLAEELRRANPNPLDGELLSPELVMRHRQEIGLTDEQSSAILDIVKEGQGNMLDAQWALAPELEKLRVLLSASKVDEDRALEQLARVLEKERGLKTLQLILMIRVKNVLEPEQHRKLKALRPDPPGR